MSKEWNEYDWSDVTPNPIPHEPSHVAQIAYSDAFKEVMGLFRAIAQSNELSERALALSTAVITLNPAHYSVWDYRLEICKAIGNRVFDYKLIGLTPESPQKPPIGENGEWLNMFTLSNAKNYQVWNYRQHLIDPTNALWYKNEKLVVDMVIEDDSKNFHAWSHLKWCVSQSLSEAPDAFDTEELLQQIDMLLADDVLNNSVWSFRYFVFHSFSQTLPTPKQELFYVFDRIAESPDNESAWSYLYGFISTASPELVLEASALARPYAEAGKSRAIAFLAETSDPESARKYWEKLAELEPWRRSFYEYRIDSLKN